MSDHTRARYRMVDSQIARRGLTNSAVLRAMREVPREAFVPEHLSRLAYVDAPLPIEAGQTISQPFIVAAMIDAAEVSASDRVLEIGAGSGYAAAVLSRVASRVIAVERQPELVTLAAQRLQRLGYANVEVHEGDGTHGWPEAAPFDVIIASASAPAIPQTLKEQLDIGGRLVMPVGETPDQQRLIKVTHIRANVFEEEDLGGVTFVPLIGAHGWSAEDAHRRRGT